MNEKTLKELLQLAPSGPEQFRPIANYDEDGDCIEFFFRNEPFKGERIDRWVTVYWGQESGEIVGSLIKDVKQLLARFPGLDIEIRDGNVRVIHMMRAPAWSSGNPVAKSRYLRIIEALEKSDPNLSANMTTCS